LLVTRDVHAPLFHTVYDGDIPDVSLFPALLDRLSAIREVAVIYPQDTLARRKEPITLSRMSPTQRKLADALRIASALEGGHTLRCANPYTTIRYFPMHG
jgi:hypothetical protein